MVVAGAKGQGKRGDAGQKYKLSNVKMSKLQGSNVQRSDYS